MAVITLTTDMYYTRPGEATESNVVSAHNVLIWEFTDDDNGVDNATIQFVARDNDNIDIYTSAVFPAYLYDDSIPILFRFDGTQIIKHIIENYFYKETSEIIEPKNYGSVIVATIKTYIGVVLESTKEAGYFVSHAINQIGDEYGANIPRLMYNDIEDIAHFLGFPNHIFMYSNIDLAAETPLLEVSDQEETANLITSLANDGTYPYDTFTTVGTEITSAIATSLSAAASVQTFNVLAGEQYLILVPDFVLTAGDAPGLFIPDTSNAIRLKAGDNAAILHCCLDKENVKLEMDQYDAGTWSCGPITIRRVHDATGEGTLGRYITDIELSHLLLDTKAKIGKMYYDLEVQNFKKQYSITVFKPCDNAVYIRWLNSSGYYSFFAFSAFPFRTVDSSPIGNIINSFSDQALANSRNRLIGYKESFNKIACIASSVPIVFRRKLMELFISPAVYLWQGKQTPNGNLITGFINSPTNPYDPNFTAFGIVIFTAIEITANIGQAESNSFEVYLNIAMDLIFFYSHKKTAAIPAPVIPDFYLVDADTDVTISNVVNPIEGPNKLTITPTATGTAKLRINTDNGDKAYFTTGEVVLKYSEIELDWILLDRVEGSHTLRDKMSFDNFECALVLPENYTQQLSGQNL